MQNGLAFWYGHDIICCESLQNYTLVMSPGVKNISKFIFDYAGANFAILKIFINYPFYTKMTRDEVTAKFYENSFEKLEHFTIKKINVTNCKVV